MSVEMLKVLDRIRFLTKARVALFELEVASVARKWDMALVCACFGHSCTFSRFEIFDILHSWLLNRFKCFLAAGLCEPSLKLPNNISSEFGTMRKLARWPWKSVAHASFK